MHRRQLRRQHRDAPDAVDDRRDRGEQVDHVGHRPGQSPRRVLRDEQRDTDRDRHGDQHGQQRNHHGDPEQVERRRTEASPPSTLHSRENRKLTWSSAIAGIARATRKIATSRIRRTMNSPDPDARAANTRSPIRRPPAAAGDRPRSEDRRFLLQRADARRFRRADRQRRIEPTLRPIDRLTADRRRRQRVSHAARVALGRSCRPAARVVARAAMRHRLPIRHRSSSPPVTKRPAGLPPVRPGARRSVSIVGDLEAALPRQLILATSA